MSKKKNSRKPVRYDISNVGDIPLPGEIPLPPSPLLQPRKPRTTSETSTLEPAAALEVPATAWEAVQTSAPVLHEPVQPKLIDSMLYKQAIEDRSRAEMNYAEVYSLNLQLVEFNERLLRKAGRFNNYKRRVRELYDKLIERAERGDTQLRDALQLTQRDLIAAERLVNEIQIENESLRVSNQAHQAGYEDLLKKFIQAEKAVETANSQFRNLVDEFENRGILLDEADKRIRANTAELDELHRTLAGTNENYSILREELAMWQNKVRELQLREAGVTALNNELAESMKKSQKQLHELEDLLKSEREQSRTKIAQLMAEIDRLRESKHADELIEKSKRVQKGETPAPTVKEVQVTSEPKANPRAQWNEFYSRWSQIIDGLSSHSTPISDMAEQKPVIQSELMSENGEIEII